MGPDTHANPPQDSPRPEKAADIEAETRAVADRLAGVMAPLEWGRHAPYVAEILRLKRQTGAIILAHNYMTPEVFHGVADFAGDSLGLAIQAAETAAPIIVMAGVAFMAETARLLCPDRTVLLPDLRAGCSLADSITADDVRALRRRHPGLPVVVYVNTSAEVKAEADICCTSANAVRVVESLGAERVIFLPDEYLGQYVASRTAVELVLWGGHCEVHERFEPADLRALRADHPGLSILAHPECPPDVLAESDFVGSTTQMVRHVGETRPEWALLVTECSMTDNVAAMFPDVRFVRPYRPCPHMKRITLPAILRSLRTMTHVVEIDPVVAGPARRSVERMLAVMHGGGS